MAIIILDEALVNKIAAGEVIERPSSIVKELIENSIDANATRIFIETKEGGKSLIKVSDNGYGMSYADAKKCWLRHSTSKIKDVEDLFSINTLGFRGEALASIAAVSELTIISKQESEISGTKIIVKGGKLVDEGDFGCPVGTIIQVRNLFYNTPARKKYLKSIEVEQRNIVDIITKYALIYPEIHFKLTHNSRFVLESPSTNDSLVNISYLYGKTTADQLIKIDYTENNYSITGLISKPSLSKSSKSHQAIYVNKRYIKKNQVISDAINDAYKTLVMVNRYPVVILNIDLESNKLDVNVHPQKSEIRIQDEKFLYDFVFNAIKSTLSNIDLFPETLHDTTKTLYEFSPTAEYLDTSEQKLLVKEAVELKTDKEVMKILGIIKKTYILAETPGNLMLIDQHALAERILYEEFTEQLKNQDVKIQEMLSPEIIQVLPKQFSTALSNKEVLKNLGYEIEEYGHNTILIRTIPIILGRQFNKLMFLDFIDELTKKGTPESLEIFFHNKIANKACRTAIKAGDEITLPQIKEYIHEFSKKDIYTCPHGRPIMIKWSFYELEKMFKRVV